MFPDLKRLERKYAKELVVIGVHSAKFTNEKDSDSIREAILRHDLEHPVVNDADFKIFKAYEIRGWPSFVVIEPEGWIVHETSGEGRFAQLDKVIGELVKTYDKQLDRKELSFTREKPPSGILKYPGKVLATADRLFITTHHRVLVTDSTGLILETIGSTEPGWKDGDFAAARFYGPQGLARRGDTLWVADTENHAIREIDLKARSVKTIAGTGQLKWDPKASGRPLETPLNSPWDLALDGDRLLVAMAGSHQIWELTRDRVGPFSGDGGEDIKDGPHATAQFAQPSGLAILGGKLYVADSEVSGIREVDLDAKGAARTIVGKGLFVFGDQDGVGGDVRLQHVLGVHARDGKLYVADAYNHKIKVCDPAKKEVRTLFGKGRKDPFYEPGGLWAWGDTLYVADTNHHAIRACDLKTGDVRTLNVRTK